jgi:membrane-associated protease RseP (regulator of RpoE activity)
MPRPARRLALAALLIVLPAFGPAPEPLAAGPSGRAVVPFDLLDSNHIVVRARINGKGPFRLIFDLGAPITLLGSKAAEASGAVKPDAPRSFLFSIRGEARVETLEVGDLTAKDLPVVVLDHPTLKALGDFLGQPLDGIVGYTFFARYRTTIDYPARQITFEPVDAPVRDLMKDLPARLAGPREARRVVLAPGALWGLELGEPDGAAGVPIRAVLADSPAAEAGLKAGDVLTTLDGRWTTSVADTYAAASGIGPGRDVAVVVLRDGKETTLTVRPREGF